MEMTTCIGDIDYFVYCHGFYFTNKPYPVEIGISEIGKYHSTQIIPVDLSDLFELVPDQVINFHLIKNVHGIENIYVHRFDGSNNDMDEEEKGDGYYGIKYKNLPSMMKRLFPKKKTVFGVKGAEQKKMLKRVLRNEEKFKILDIEEVFGCRLQINTYLKFAPTLHKGFHEYPFEDTCAAKIAFNYAEFLRDRFKFGDIESLKFKGESYWDEIPVANEQLQQQQQQQQQNVIEEKNNFPSPGPSTITAFEPKFYYNNNNNSDNNSTNWRNQDHNDDDEIQTIDMEPQQQQPQQQPNLPVIENNFIPSPQQQNMSGENRRYFHTTNWDRW